MLHASFALVTASAFAAGNLFEPGPAPAGQDSFFGGCEPTIREREEITQSYPAYVRNECVWLDIRVSAQDARYAVAGAQVLNWQKQGSRCLRYASNGFDVLKKTGRKWRSIFAGSVEPPCSLGIPRDLIGCRGKR